MVKYALIDIVDALARVFESAGLPAADARLCADWLADAEASGVPSHGVTRAPMYLQALKRGKINARPNIVVEQTRAGVLLVDGDNGMGPVVGAVAIDRAMAAASGTGIAIAAVRRSNHYGAPAYLLRRATSAGFIGFTCSNGSRAMAVWGGADPIISTNPLAAAFPDWKPGVSLSFDMATSVAAFGRIRLAQREGKAIPADWAVAPDGGPTTDPEEAMRGALLPMGGSKGSALALMVEMLAGVLAGAGIGRHVGNPNDHAPEPADVGHTFMVLDVAGFMPPDVYAARAASLAELVQTSRPAAGVDAVRLPGARGAERRRHATDHWLDLPEETVKILQKALNDADFSLPPSLP